MNDMTLKKFGDIVQKFREARDWQNSDLKDGALSLVLEATEVLELFQWIQGDVARKNEKLRAAIAEELTDVLWWVLVMSRELDIDIADEFMKKMKKRTDKYPLEKFGKQVDPMIRNKHYYQMKAATRGGHPLAEE